MNEGSEWVCWRRRGVGGQLWSGCVKEGEGLQLGGSCGVGVLKGERGCNWEAAVG